MAALAPGDWTHLVVLASPKLQYAWFSGTYFFGYQMPLPLNTVGILLETEQNLGYVKELSTLRFEALRTSRFLHPHRFRFQLG